MRPKVGSRYEGNTNLEIAIALDTFVYSQLCADSFGNVKDYGFFGIVLDPFTLPHPVYIVELDEAGKFSYLEFEGRKDGLAHWNLLKKSYAEYETERLAEAEKYSKKKKKVAA